MKYLSAGKFLKPDRPDPRHTRGYRRYRGAHGIEVAVWRRTPTGYYLQETIRRAERRQRIYQLSYPSLTTEEEIWGAWVEANQCRPGTVLVADTGWIAE